MTHDPPPARATRAGGGALAARMGPLAPYLPAVGVLAVWIAWAATSGGYFPRDWYPGAVALVVLLAVVVLAGPRALPAHRAARLALALLVGLVAWAYLSMAWAGSAGAAWEAANLLLAYLASAWLLALVPWGPRSATLFLGTWSVGVAAVCLASLIGALGAEDPNTYIVDYRWSEPVGYTNGSAALAVLGAWPALVLASRRETPSWLTPFLLAVATFLVEFSLLAQSRAAMLSMAVGLLVLLALAPGVLRLLARLAVIGGAVAASVSPVFAVYTAAVEERPVPPALRHAARAIGLTVAAALVAGALLAALERGIRPSERLVRGMHCAAAVLAAAALLAGASAAVARNGDIRSYVRDHWNTFSSDRETPNVTGPRLTANYADQRHDYWRVALDLFREAPVTGAGAGNFERRYAAAKRFNKPSRYVHDVWLRFLGETGVVGVGLLLGFLLAALGPLVLACRRLAPPRRALVATCVVMTTAVLVHASFDWLDQIPALAAPALALPLLALSLALGERPPAAVRRPRAVRALLAAAALAALGSLVAPYLAVRYVDRATTGWQSDQAGAYRDLDRAAGLNPLSVQPHLTEGTIALTAEDEARARAAFARAIRVEDNWYAHFELALLDAQAGRFVPARREIERADALNATDDLVREARRRILARRHIDAAAFNRKVLQLPLYKRRKLT